MCVSFKGNTGRQESHPPPSFITETLLYPELKILTFTSMNIQIKLRAQHAIGLLKWVSRKNVIQVTFICRFLRQAMAS